MKILRLGDLHFGVKRDDPWLQAIQRDGIRQAIEYSKANGITQWIQLGDWFDVRAAITHTTMHFNTDMCNQIRDAGIKVDVIVGNHDAKYKNTLTPNACTELLTQFDNITVYDKPTTVDYDGLKIDLVPWICQDNEQEIFDFIKQSTSTHNCGHYELNGFYFYKGLKSHGIEPDFLCRYERVDAGHFHTASENRNVYYNGTPWTLTAGDSNDVRGFYEFDTATRENKFIPNETMWHKTLTYPCSINPEDYRNLAVRVIVTKIDNNLAKFETALEEVVHELNIVNRVNNQVDTDFAESEDVDIKPLPDLMDEYVDAIQDSTSEDIDAIKVMVKTLYLEASQ